jgi:hypothetical protein
VLDVKFEHEAPDARSAGLHCRTIGTDVTVERTVVQDVVGVPLRGKLQLRIDLDVGGTAGLVLNGVDIGHHTAVEPPAMRTAA